MIVLPVGSSSVVDGNLERISSYTITRIWTNGEQAPWVSPQPNKAISEHAATQKVK